MSTSMFPLASPRGTLRVSGKQNSPFSLGPVIKCLLFTYILLVINLFCGLPTLSSNKEARHTGSMVLLPTIGKNLVPYISIMCGSWEAGKEQ